MPFSNSFNSVHGAGAFISHPSHETDIFGPLGGGSTGPGNLAAMLAALGIDTGGQSAKTYAGGNLLASLLRQLNAPTGLEGFYGPGFQSRATGATLAQTSAPFAEAGRALTGGYLRSGQGYGGQLLAARADLARGQGQTSGNAIQQLLMSLEGQRAGLVPQMEAIRTGRQSLLANYLNRIAAQGLAQRQQESQEKQSTGTAIGAGVGSIAALLPYLLPLLGICVVAEELFGTDSPEFKAARNYMLTDAPDWLREGYREHGPEIVEMVKTDPSFRESVTPLFRWFAAKGAAEVV